MKEFLRGKPLLVGAAALVIGVGGISLPINGTPPSAGSVCVRIVLFVIMMGIAALMGAKKPLLGMEGFGSTMIRSWYVLIFMIALGILMVISPYTMEMTAKELIMKELAVLAFCISVGLFEEALFRGVVMRALIMKMGTSHKSLICSAIISSLIFGFVHVYTYVFGGSYDILGIAQSVFKTLQTAALGLFLAALYIKYRNIWAIALIHCLNDFFPMQGYYITEHSNQLGDYVSGGEQGIASLVLYIVMIVIFIPVIIYSFRLILKTDMSERDDII